MHIVESSGYRDFEWAVKIHRLSLETMGLWPKYDKYNKNNLWLKLRVGIILVLLIFVTNVPMIHAIIQVWGNMVLVIENLRSILPLLIASVKYVIMLWKQTVFLSIINMMMEDWMAFKFNTERAVMIKQAQTARIIMIIGYIIIIMTVLLLTISSSFGIQTVLAINFTDRRKFLPLFTYHFYDVNKSPQFELTFFIQTISILFATTIYMSVDILLALLVLHICGQMENFRCQLVNLISCKKFNRTLNDIVMSHLRIIRFVDKIENTYSLMMLIMIFHFVIVFCLSGFLFTIFLIDREMDKVITTKIYFLIIMLFILLMNTFLYCGAGELITEQCNAVYRTMCDLEWYKLESRKVKGFILLMIRMRHPLCISAGKIIPLTMATFCSILKTSTGYISFLLTKRS
ncbi:odorant receptor 43a [Monomorium pharaonis]|uniref:odorant receptor 43a n=1 Tax=Monomorium pharaonis TaxID=307658 RepID=UPI00063F81A5|nr:odorant receptor 43a [Monomorium pharaonis]